MTDFSTGTLNAIKYRLFTYKLRKRERGVWSCLKAEAGTRTVEIYLSPTGRSSRIYVDGTEIKRARK